MDRFNFKGDVESLRTVHLEFIGDVVHKRGFSPAAEVNIQILGKAGDNYMSSVKRIQVSENGKNLYMVAKFAPEQQMMRDMTGTTEFFMNETIIYSELFPKFKELQKSANVPPEDMFKFAEWYGSYLNEPSEAILLEDLSKDNYKILDKLKPLPEDCVRMTLKQFAILHSLSLILKNREPETFKAISSKLVDAFTIPSRMNTEESKTMMKQFENFAINSVSGEKYKRILKNTTSNTYNQAVELNKYDIGSKYSIIQQGDGWTNNILFKHNGDKPTGCVLIDYQNSRENSGAWDLIFMLFTSTTHEMRLKHYHEYLDIYYTEMGKSLNYFGLDIAKVYPREQLNVDLKRQAKITLSIAVIIMGFIVRKSDNASAVQEKMQNISLENKDEMEKNMSFGDDDTLILYRQKVEGFIDSLLEFGLIDEA